MKKLSLFILILMLALQSYSQSYIGWIDREVNFREGPTDKDEIISKLKKGVQIFIISLETENNYYNVIDITTDKEGYVHKSYIKIGKKIEINEKGMFTPTGKTLTYDSEIEIFNNTQTNLTLKLNDEKFTFAPYEKRKMTLKPGLYNYRASAPGVIPNIGNENMESSIGYTWQFYIVRRLR